MQKVTPDPQVVARSPDAELDIEMGHVGRDTDAAARPYKPCCTITTCCGSRASWRDIYMGTVEVATGGVGVTSTVANAILTPATPVGYYIGGICGVLLLAELGVHYLWRRDAVAADLHRTAESLQQTEQQLEETAEKADAVAKQLTKENARLTDEVRELQKAQDQFEAARRDLGKQLTVLQDANQKFAAENKDLSLQNKQLKVQVGKLQEILGALKDYLSRFNELNASLKGNVGNLGQVVSQFGSEENSLKLDLSQIDKELGKQISGLAAQVTLTQKTGKELLAEFADQIQKFQSQIQQLESLEKGVDKDEDDIQRREQELLALQKKISEASDALSSRQKEFQQIDQALNSAKQSLSETLQKLSQTDSKLSSDTSGLKAVTETLTQVALHLDQMGDRLTKDIQSISSISAATTQQTDEINKL
ncbi:MAG: hypothetical protein JSS60_07595 [Verrucomicrobia bacterium]|nr:hypothetical protein [Verrucomicrobiota bacterium]